MSEREPYIDARFCFIDGCRNPTVWFRANYPDDEFLCDEHRRMVEGDEDWDPPNPWVRVR